MVGDYNKTFKDNGLSQGFFTEKEAAAFLGFSPRALQNWRMRGGGPKYFKVSTRAVRYRQRELVEWCEDSVRSHSSETNTS